MLKCEVCDSHFVSNRTDKLYCSKFCREKKRRSLPKRKEQMKDFRRKYLLKANYNLTLERYDDLLKSQNGNCALCNRPPLGKALAVDHCHITGRIRGLLCTICNRQVIGNKDITFFQKCIKYLKEPKVNEA